MLSCRVQGKLIEKAFFSYLIERCSEDTVTLEVNFKSTRRNKLAKSVLEEIGFSMHADTPSTIKVKHGELNVDFLDLRLDAVADNENTGVPVSD